MQNFFKLQIISFLIAFILFYFFFSELISFSYEPTKTVIITKEDILNATPTKNKVSFSQKELKSIEMLEKRHFLTTFPSLTDYERLKNLENELLGRTWEYTDKKSRIDTLKIASTNIILQGTALPASISSKQHAKRLRNDSIIIKRKDDVGLIDGFLRLISPEKYEIYKKSSDRMFNDYEY